MARSVRDIVASVMGPREGVLPSIQAFPPLDIDELARKLRLDERAAEAGTAGQPSSDAKVPELVEVDVTSEIQRRARKATEDFRSQLNLYDASGSVLANQGAAGVDHQSVADFEAHRSEELRRLGEALRTDTYRPQAIRRVWIPKPGSSEKRPLGIPTVCP